MAILPTRYMVSEVNLMSYTVFGAGGGVVLFSRLKCFSNGCPTRGSYSSGT